MTEPEEPQQSPLDLSALEAMMQNHSVVRQAEESPDDTGNALRYARLCGDRVRYLAAEKKWLVWDGRRWRRDETGQAFYMTELVIRDVRQYAFAVPEDRRPEWQSWSRTTASVGHRDAMLRIASMLPDLIAQPAELDSHRYWLNAPNALIDLATGQIRDPVPTDLITRQTLVPYQPEIAWTPLLLDFMTTFMPDMDEWRYLMKIIGSTLIGGNQWRLWLIIYGPSTTGKTQFTEAVAKLLGDYASPVNTSVFRANLDDRPRPDLLRALSSRLAYAMEGSSSWELHADHLKRMTGEDPLVARAMRSDVMVERVPDFTPLIVCNSYPRLKGSADQAVRRRLHVLPFTNSVLGNEDPHKRAAFAADEQTHIALLTQLIDGAIRSLNEGIDDQPVRFAEATFDAFGELNGVTDYLNYLRESKQVIEEETSALQCWQVSDLYQSYIHWLELFGSADDRRSRLGMRQFNHELHQLGWETVRSSGYRWLNKRRLDYAPERFGQ